MEHGPPSRQFPMSTPVTEAALWAHVGLGPRLRTKYSLDLVRPCRDPVVRRFCSCFAMCLLTNVTLVFRLFLFVFCHALTARLLFNFRAGLAHNIFLQISNNNKTRLF
ncbi:hypothetical protein BJX62DRAFT_88369 [Aspergillus germanicus]